MPGRPLNATAASLLGFLHHGPLSGWDLLVTARTAIGQFWSITQSQVYRELAAMERAGLITAQRSGARDRRPYQLTDAGRSAFLEWLSREPGPEQIRYPLLLTMSFGAHLPPQTLGRFVEAHRRLHADRLAEYEHARKAADGAVQSGEADLYVLATLDFGIRYERAVLEWVDALPAAVRSGADRPETPGSSPRNSRIIAPELPDDREGGGRGRRGRPS